MVGQEYQSKEFLQRLLRQTGAELASFKPVGSLRLERAWADYTVRIYRDSSHLALGSFEILRSGRILLAAEGGRFFIGSPNQEMEEEQPEAAVLFGRDITGNGVPDLVVSEYSGGSHCCLDFYVFEIGQDLRLLDVLQAQHSGRAEFVDMDGDSNLEFAMQDWTFAYWRTSFAESPAPDIILRFRDKGYHLAVDLMRKPAPSPGQLSSWAAELRGNENWRGGEPPPLLWDKMLVLIYSGHMDLAWSLFETAWPSGVRGKDKFLKEFRQKLAESPYWPEIQALNLGRPDD